MEIVDFIILVIIALVIFLAIRKIIKDKKNGFKCVGCPGCNVNGNKNISKSSPCSSCPSRK